MAESLRARGARRGSAIRPFLVPVLVLSFALSGCQVIGQFVGLEREIKKMEKFTAIEGEIVRSKPNDNSVVVALFSEKLRLDQLVNVKLVDAKTFRFGVPPGKYAIFAFEDANGDFQYQPHEPAGFVGEPAPLVVSADSPRTRARIEIRGPLARPRPKSAEPPTPNQMPKLWAGIKNIGAIRQLDDPRFDRRVAKMGTWEPLRFSLEIGPGLYLLEPYDRRKIPVVFVHGINGSPIDWKTVIANLDRDRFQPLVLSYASGLPLNANANYFFNAVTQLRHRHRFDTLILVAHSMGGLVSQGFIDRYRKSGDRYLKLFVTVSTPWAGHNAAQWAKLAPVEVPVWKDMAPDSKYLAAVKQSRLPDGLPFHLLFGYRGGGLPGWTANDGAVTLKSQLEPAVVARTTQLHPFDASHTGILSDKASVGLIHKLLREAGGRGARNR